MKHNLHFFRQVYRDGGWREVRRCLNCLWGPSALRRVFQAKRRSFQITRLIKCMTHEEQANLRAALEELAK
jgi:hypothetical protein